MWWSASTCNGDTKLLKEKWVSIVNYAVNKHKCRRGNDLFTKCEHHQLSREEKKEVAWLKQGSSSHVALEEVVTDRRIHRDIEKLTEFHHTGALEVYHSLMLKYVPKREHFSYNGMEARLQLSALDNNFDCNREHAVIKSGMNKGTLRYKVKCPKRNKNWVAKPIREAKSYPHLPE